jgi:hypothetical protein
MSMRPAHVFAIGGSVLALILVVAIECMKEPNSPEPLDFIDSSKVAVAIETDSVGRPAEQMPSHSIRIPADQKVPAETAPKPHRWTDDSAVDSRLGRMRFRFDQKLRNAEMVMQNDYFNPGGRVLPEVRSIELDKLLTDIIREASLLEQAYRDTRDRHIQHRLDNADFEPLSSADYTGDQRNLRPRNDEEEVVSIVNSQHGRCLVRIGWDTDPMIREGRNALLEFKTQAVTQIVEFVELNSVSAK